jgi:hypothetical protein
MSPIKFLSLIKKYRILQDDDDVIEKALVSNSIVIFHDELKTKGFVNVKEIQALVMMDENKNITFFKKAPDKDFDISQQHLGRIMRNHNRTRKRTRHEHFPSERRKITTDKEKELDDFYNTVKQYPVDGVGLIK